MVNKKTIIGIAILILIIGGIGITGYKIGENKGIQDTSIMMIDGIAEFSKTCKLIEFYTSNNETQSLININCLDLENGR